jgi:mono/diheme cytochrome c family protein
MAMTALAMTAHTMKAQIVADWLNALAVAVPWPLPVRPSTENLLDPGARQILGICFAAFGLAVLLVTMAFVARRGMIFAGLVAVIVVVVQGHNLGLLLVDATPASYRASPTGFSAASIAAGRRVFAANCVPCHGKAGDGTGGLGQAANLRSPHIWSHPDGDLFWFISHGIAAHDGIPAMPAWRDSLSEEARWNVIDYIHALNAGSVTRGLDGWPHLVPAPNASLSCDSLAAHSIGDLRGKAIRLILGSLPQPLPALPPVNGIEVVTVWMPGDAAEAIPAHGVDCLAQSSHTPGAPDRGGPDRGPPRQRGPDPAEAYAILAGAADGHLIPARFLIDPEGVLRSVWREGDGDEWADPQRLLEEVRTICTEPLTIDTGGEHEHHH